MPHYKSEDEIDSESKPLDPAIYSDGRSLKNRRYVECPECEGCFALAHKADPLPNHRAFNSEGRCLGSGKAGV